MIVCDYELGEVKKRELSSDEKQNVCDYVVSRWNAWSKPLGLLQDNTKVIRERATPSICDKSAKKEDWHSKIQLNRMYEFYNKLYGIFPCITQNLPYTRIPFPFTSLFYLPSLTHLSNTTPRSLFR